MLIIALSYTKPEKVVSFLRWSLFGFFLLASLDVILSRYHLWQFQPVEPKPKRFALVTGAAGGLGREIAYALAEKKYSIVLVAKPEPILERMRAEIEFVNKPVDVEYCACDLSTPAGTQKLLDFLKDKNLVIDILVNAAADTEIKLFHELPADKVESLLQINVNATTRITHTVVEGMVKRGIGRVLNISTLGAVASSPNAAIFGASKAFITSFSQAINYELRSTGVTVTSFNPGPMEVNLNDPNVGKKQLSTAEYWPFVVHPKDLAALAINALFNADDVAYDAYLTQLLAFLLRAVIPPRVGQALVAISWQTPRNVIQQLKR